MKNNKLDTLDLSTEKAILLEQYKLFVETSDKLSGRRQQVNQFYIGILSGLLAVLGFILEKNVNQNMDGKLVFFLTACLGLVLCFVWDTNIRSYKQLNSGKFKVIHELENQLPYALFKKEWEYLGEGKDGVRYKKLTAIERYVPWIMSFPYFIILLYSIFVMA